MSGYMEQCLKDPLGKFQKIYLKGVSAKIVGPLKENPREILKNNLHFSEKKPSFEILSLILKKSPREIANNILGKKILQKMFQEEFVKEPG